MLRNSLKKGVFICLPQTAQTLFIDTPLRQLAKN